MIVWDLLALAQDDEVAQMQAIRQLPQPGRCEACGAPLDGHDSPEWKIDVCRRCVAYLSPYGGEA